MVFRVRLPLLIYGECVAAFRIQRDGINRPGEIRFVNSIDKALVPERRDSAQHFFNCSPVGDFTVFTLPICWFFAFAFDLFEFSRDCSSGNDKGF